MVSVFYSKLQAPMKHLITILILNVVLFSTNTYAQTTYQPSKSGLPTVCNILNFALSDDGTIFTIVSVVDDKAYVYKSTDNGVNWSVISQSGLPQWFNSIEYVNNSLIIGTWETGSIVYRSTNNGINWNASNAGLPAKCNILDFTVANGSVYSIVSVIDDKTYLYKSSDDGVNWSVVNQIGLPTWFNSIGFSNDTLLIGTWNEGGLMYNSIDNGLTWSVSNTGLPLGSNMLSMTKVNGNIYAIASIVGDKAYVYKSSDNGLNWSVINQTGLPTWFNCLGFSNDALLVGTWDEGSIMYKSEVIVTSVFNINKMDAKFAYPNPFDNIVYFNYNSDIELLTTEGKKILSKKNISNVDLNFLAPGVYILTNGSLFQRIIKN